MYPFAGGEFSASGQLDWPPFQVGHASNDCGGHRGRACARMAAGAQWLSLQTPVACGRERLSLCMRPYLTFHLALLIGANWAFRYLTHPNDDQWFAPSLWIAFNVAASASLLVLFGFLRRSKGLGGRLVGFACAWICFYFLWSWGVVFASRARYDLMLRLNEEPFVLFGATSGMQFTSWNHGSHFFFLAAAIPICVFAAICSLGFHAWSYRRRTHEPKP